MVTSIVLARLLMPADFGIVAMATMVTGMAQIFRDLGLGQALIQRPDISKEHTRSAFWGTLVMALLLYAAVFVAAPYVGAFFDEPRMVPVLKVIALAFVLSPFAVVPRSLLQRELDFKTPFLPELVSSVAYGAVGVVMALTDFGYWALVGAALASGFTRTVALCIVTRYVPPLVPTFRGIRDLYSFGVGVTLSGMLNYASNKVDYFIVGKRLSTDALGIYTRSFTIVQRISELVTGIISPVLFPAFARLQSHPPRLRSAFRRTTTVMCVVAWPCQVLIAVTAPELVPGILGEQWQEAVVPTQIMTVFGCYFIIGAIIGACLRGMGLVFIQVVFQVVRVALVTAAVWIGTEYGVTGAAVGALIAITGSFLFTFIVTERYIRLSPAGWWHAVRSALLAIIVAGVFSYTAKIAAYAAGAGPMVAAGTAVVAGGASVIGLVLWAPLSELRLLTDVWNQFRKRAL